MSAIAAPEEWDITRFPLTTRRIGRPLRHYASVPSTMPLAHDFAAAGAPDGAAILADEQTAGRGRRGRTWSAAPGGAILCSLICRPPLRAEDLFLLTAAVSVGLRAGVARETGLTPGIKWPNDLLLDGRKLAGILAESRFSTGGLIHAVVGFGLNVNLAAADFPLTPPGGLAPTSLALALGHPVDRLALLRAVLEEIDNAYDLLWRGDLDELRARWQARLVGIGELIRVETDAGPLHGHFRGVAADGALLLDTGTAVARVLVGDVVVGPRPLPRAD